MKGIGRRIAEFVAPEGSFTGPGVRPRTFEEARRALEAQGPRRKAVFDTGVPLTGAELAGTDVGLALAEALTGFLKG